MTVPLGGLLDGIAPEAYTAPQTDAGVDLPARRAVGVWWEVLERLTAETDATPHEIGVFGSFATGDAGVRSREKYHDELDGAVGGGELSEQDRGRAKSGFDPEGVDSPDTAAAVIGDLFADRDTAETVTVAAVSDIDGYVSVSLDGYDGPPSESSVEFITEVYERFGKGVEAEIIPETNEYIFRNSTHPYKPTFLWQRKDLDLPRYAEDAVRWTADMF